MDIADIVSEEYVSFPPDARVSKLVGAFDDPAVEGVVVHGDEFEGVVTRKQLATSHHPPDEKVQKHDETFRGTPLLLARIRLHTDRGLYIASGEGYGAKHALHEARDVLERRIRDRKTYGRCKKHPGEEYWEKRFGWLLEE